MPPAYLKGISTQDSALTPNHWCAGKVRFDSAKLAATVANRSKTIGRRDTYRCQTCGKWHVGVTKWRSEGATER
jgi:hypothetical protein